MVSGLTNQILVQSGNGYLYWSDVNNDIYVTGGTYNPSNGIITFFNNNGGTFDVNGITNISTLSGLTDTIINLPKEGDKLIYSGNSWVNVEDVDLVYTQDLSTGGTYEFVVGEKKNNGFFIHFMNYRDDGSGTQKVFQMGELQLLHNDIDAQVTTNGQDIDLYITYAARLDGNDVILICEVPSNINTSVIMKYTKERFKG